MSKTKKKIAREVPESAGHLKEPKSIIFENGPTSNDDFTNEFHSLPCKIEYDGSAKVSQYFVTEDLGDEKKVTTFRGRILNGVKQQFPGNYRLYVAVEKENKDNNRVFEVSGSATSFMRWEYDHSTSYRSPLVRAIDYVNIAEKFATDDD
uniref:Bet_v_1 domain-containing protein n=1 Tax=Elaeophora elaphi TaxID=1147741 RepID=A0A0R3RUB4_9BILA